MFFLVQKQTPLLYQTTDWSYVSLSESVTICDLLSLALSPAQAVNNMPVSTCNACNATFTDDALRGRHYRSDWHRYNLKRKVAGLPGVTEEWFDKRRETLAAESGSGDRLLYRCTLCNKDYGSQKAHANHVLSRLHLSNAAAHPEKATDIAVLRPAPLHAEGGGEDDEEDSWIEVDEDGRDGGETGGGEQPEAGGAGADAAPWDVARCLFCLKDFGAAGDVGSCVEHMHRAHGFFVPDADYLSDVEGLLQYLGAKISDWHMCLYCDERGRAFASADAARKHMDAKNHCKLRYGDGSGAAEEELADFYDFPSRESEHEEWQVVGPDGAPPAAADALALTTNDAELAVSSGGGGGDGSGVARILGSRELARYYSQKPRPSEQRSGVVANLVAAKYRSLGLTTRSMGPMQFRRDTAGGRQAEQQRSIQGARNNTIHGLSSHSVSWNR